MTRTTAQSVYDVVVRLPKTLGPAATVGDARLALEDDHVHMLLITEAGRLLGTLVRHDLPPPVDDSKPAVEHSALTGRTIDPATSVEEARRILLSHGERRRAVVTTDGHLLGLLCLKRSRAGFCSDGDVRARALAQAGGTAAGVDPTCVDLAEGT